jgi:AraC-like DNA-binding protein
MATRRTSFYQELPPPPDLAPYVACTWTRCIDPSEAGTRQPIIPDACADIVIVADQPPHLAGPADRAAWVTLRGGTMVTGVRFRPGAAREVLRCEMAELRNADVPLEDVVGRDARELDRERSVDALLRWVRARLARRRHASPCDIASVLLDARSIDDATEDLGWSARRMHRHVTGSCGYGPKLVHRILRLQRAIRLAHDPRAPTLVAVAVAADYADQAHMTREFVALTDLTPSSYLQQADPRVGTWLVSDLFKTTRRA